MSDRKDFWFGMLADPGFLLLPNGLSWQGTTFWIRSWQSEEQGELLSWLGTEQYEARLMGLSIWCEEEAVKQHLALLSFSAQLLLQKLRIEHIPFPREAEEAHYLWDEGREDRLHNLHLAEGEERLLKTLLSLLSLILSEIGLLETPETYTAEMNRVQALIEYLDYGFCYVSIARKQQGEPLAEEANH